LLGIYFTLRSILGEIERVSPSPISAPVVFTIMDRSTEGCGLPVAVAAGLGLYLSH
jgi:hypothetical protein